MELKKNPFFILKVGCDADRAAINASAEELAFFDEEGNVEQAQLTLLNPAKRLTAEMDWFPGLSQAELEQVSKAIEENHPINITMQPLNDGKEADIRNCDRRGVVKQEAAHGQNNTAETIHASQGISDKKTNIEDLLSHWNGDKDYIRKLITKHSTIADYDMARNKGLSSNNAPNEKYCLLYWIYRNLLDSYLRQKLNLAEYDRRIENSGLKFIPVKQTDMDFHQYLSTMGLSFFYLRNELYLEKLSPADIDVLLGLTPKDVMNPKSETLRIIERTWKTVIDFSVEPGIKGMSRYGPDSDNYWFESDQLVIGFRHDDFADNGLGEDDAWGKNNNLQIALINTVLAELRNYGKSSMNQTVNAIWYNDYTIAETIVSELGISAEK